MSKFIANGFMCKGLKVTLSYETDPQIEKDTPRFTFERFDDRTGWEKVFLGNRELFREFIRSCQELDEGFDYSTLEGDKNA